MNVGNKKSNLLQKLICLFSGVAMGMCVLFPTIGPAVFVLAIPAMVVLQRQTKVRRIYVCSIAFSLGLCMTGYFPALYIKPDVAENLIFWIDLAVYVVICLVHTLVLSTALWLGAKLPCPKCLRWIYIALFWTLAEWLIGSGPFAWPTLRLSLSLWKYPELIQTARFGGQLLVTALIMAVNVLLAEGVLLLKSKRALFPLSLATIMIIGNIIIGFALPSAPKADTDIAVIQPGTVVINNQRGNVYNEALALTKEAAKNKPELIILSESILPEHFREYSFFEHEWGDVSRESGSDILVGGRHNDRSVAYHYGADGKIQNTYEKIREVPFFENGVGEKTFSWIPEESQGTVTTQIGKVGVMICYESMFSTMAQNLVDQDAKLIAVQTNDSWFDTDVAKDIHLGHGVYRGIETGRTLVQAGLNGNTAVVDYNGKIINEISHTDKGILLTKVSLETNDTIYNRLGNSWLFVGIAIVLVLTFCERFRK